MNTLGNVVSKSTPLLGGILNSLLPGSGLLLSALMNLFGVKTNSEADLAAAIQSDPNAAEKLQEFQIAHKYDLMQIQTADRVSAREMNIATTKATGRVDYMIHALAWIVVIGLFSYIILGYFYPGNFNRNVMHDLINLAMIPLLFYFGGIYPPNKYGNQEATLPPPAQTR